MIILQYARRFPTTSAGPWPIHLQRRWQIQFRWHSLNHWQLFFRNIAHSVFILAIVFEYYVINNFPVLIFFCWGGGGGGGEGCSREGARQAKWFIETQTRKGTSPCKKKRQATKMLGKRQIIIIVISFNLTR